MTTESVPKKQIKVICAGLGRTGTYSLTEALEVLGYKPCHFVDFGHAADWAALARGDKTSDDLIDRIVEDGYTTVLDNPCCDIYQDILRRYPDAKVILTVRDNGEKFEHSWKLLFDTMVVTEQPFSLRFPSFFGWIPLFQNLKQTRYFMGTTHLGLKPGELTHGWRNKPAGWIAEQYDRHNQHVRDHVPSKQLLIFNVKQGWKPLCDFLGCDVPEGRPFPHSTMNDKAGLIRLRKQFLWVVYGWIPVLVVTTLASAYTFGRRGTSSKSEL